MSDEVRVNSITFFRVGQYVELHPGTDRWMMGDMYGTVTKVDTKNNSVRVKLTKSGQSFAFHPDNILNRSNREG